MQKKKEKRKALVIRNSACELYRTYMYVNVGNQKMYDSIYI